MKRPLHDLKAVLLFAAVLCSMSASANSAGVGQPMAGRFTTAGGTVSIKGQANSDDFQVSLKRDTGHCSGELSGHGKGYLSNVVTLSEADPASGTTCTVDLLYSPDFTALDVKESAACLVWHGAGCSFQGTYRRRR